ncbi:hypothetical protein BDV12DRAFT_179701, partial [Aspergillus spectabilis]
MKKTHHARLLPHLLRPLLHPLTTHRYGQRTPKAFRRRRARVARRAYWKTHGIDVYETDGEDEETREERVRVMGTQIENQDRDPHGDGDEGEEDDYEDSSYDPEVFSDEDETWLDNVSGLGAVWDSCERDGDGQGRYGCWFSRVDIMSELAGYSNLNIACGDIQGKFRTGGVYPVKRYIAFFI